MGSVELVEYLVAFFVSLRELKWQKYFILEGGSVIQTLIRNYETN